MAPTATITGEETQITESGLDDLLANLDDLIQAATSSEDEGDAALAIRSIAW